MGERRRLRPKQRISYFEPEEPNLDEYVFCENCGDYVYEYCAIHGSLAVVLDDKVPEKHNFPSFVPRAALTIPKVFLHLNYSTIPGAGLGVFTTLTLPKGVRFGPYRGVKTKEVNSDYCWQIYDKDRKPSHVVDASDGNNSNWMRFVNCSRHWCEQNLVAFQYQGELYYRTIKIIPRFTELMVFYGSQFASKLHIHLGRYNAPKSYAQKFGAPKKPKSNPEIKKPQKVTEFSKDNNYKEISPPATLDNTQTPATAGNNTNKRPGENISEIQKEAPAVKKRKANAEKKKRQPQKTKAKPVKQNVKSALEGQESIKNKKEVSKNEFSKPSQRIVNGQNKIDTDLNTKTALVQSNDEENNVGNRVQTNTPSEINVKHVSNELVNILVQKENQNGNVEQKISIAKQNEIQINTHDAYFTCNECSYRNVSKEILNNHVRFHDVNKKFACLTCGYRFTTNSSLNRHKLRHKNDKKLGYTGEKTFSCNTCDYQCMHANSLKTHLRTHTGEKPYSCSVCDHQFTQSSSLKTHLRTHTGEKPHSCSLCDYKCSDAGNLKTHLRTHTEEKPYSCSVCDYKCSQAGHLKTHLRTHTEEKPYSCSVCDYKCSHACSLKTHLRTHTGEKPYSCDICDYKCSQVIQLKRHLKKHLC